MLGWRSPVTSRLDREDRPQARSRIPGEGGPPPSVRREMDAGKEAMDRCTKLGPSLLHLRVVELQGKELRREEGGVAQRSRTDCRTRSSNRSSEVVSHRPPEANATTNSGRITSMSRVESGFIGMGQVSRGWARGLNSAKRTRRIGPA